MHRGFETRHDHISNQRQPHNQSFQQQQEHQVYHEPTRAYQPQEGRGQSSSRSGVGSFTFSDHPYPPYPPATTPKDETVPSNNLHSIRERLSKHSRFEELLRSYSETQGPSSDAVQTQSDVQPRGSLSGDEQHMSFNSLLNLPRAQQQRYESRSNSNHHSSPYQTNNSGFESKVRSTHEAITTYPSSLPSQPQHQNYTSYSDHYSGFSASNNLNLEIPNPSAIQFEEPSGQNHKDLNKGYESKNGTDLSGLSGGDMSTTLGTSLAKSMRAFLSGEHTVESLLQDASNRDRFQSNLYSPKGFRLHQKYPDDDEISQPQPGPSFTDSKEYNYPNASWQRLLADDHGSTTTAGSHVYTELPHPEQEMTASTASLRFLESLEQEDLRLRRILAKENWQSSEFDIVGSQDPHREFGHIISANQRTPDATSTLTEKGLSSVYSTTSSFSTTQDFASSKDITTQTSKIAHNSYDPTEQFPSDSKMRNTNNEIQSITNAQSPSMSTSNSLSHRERFGFNESQSFNESRYGFSTLLDATDRSMVSPHHLHQTSNHRSVHAGPSSSSSRTGQTSSVSTLQHQALSPPTHTEQISDEDTYSITQQDVTDLLHRRQSRNDEKNKHPTKTQKLYSHDQNHDLFDVDEVEKVEEEEEEEEESLKIDSISATAEEAIHLTDNEDANNSNHDPAEEKKEKAIRDMDFREPEKEHGPVSSSMEVKQEQKIGNSLSMKDSTDCNINNREDRSESHSSIRESLLKFPSMSASRLSEDPRLFSNQHDRWKMTNQTPIQPRLTEEELVRLRQDGDMAAILERLNDSAARLFEHEHESTVLNTSPSSRSDVWRPSDMKASSFSNASHQNHKKQYSHQHAVTIVQDSLDDDSQLSRLGHASTQDWSSSTFVTEDTIDSRNMHSYPYQRLPVNLRNRKVSPLILGELGTSTSAHTETTNTTPLPNTTTPTPTSPSMSSLTAVKHGTAKSKKSLSRERQSLEREDSLNKSNTYSFAENQAMLRKILTDVRDKNQLRQVLANLLSALDTTSNPSSNQKHYKPDNHSSSHCSQGIEEEVPHDSAWNVFLGEETQISDSLAASRHRPASSDQRITSSRHPSKESPSLQRKEYFAVKISEKQENNLKQIDLKNRQRPEDRDHILDINSNSSLHQRPLSTSHASSQQSSSVAMNSNDSLEDSKVKPRHDLLRMPDLEALIATWDDVSGLRASAGEDDDPQQKIRIPGKRTDGFYNPTLSTSQHLEPEIDEGDEDNDDFDDHDERPGEFSIEREDMKTKYQSSNQFDSNLQRKRPYVDSRKSVRSLEEAHDKREIHATKYKQLNVSPKNVISENNQQNGKAEDGNENINDEETRGGENRSLHRTDSRATSIGADGRASQRSHAADSLASSAASRRPKSPLGHHAQQLQNQNDCHLYIEKEPTPLLRSSIAQDSLYPPREEHKQETRALQSSFPDNGTSNVKDSLLNSQESVSDQKVIPIDVTLSADTAAYIQVSRNKDGISPTIDKLSQNKQMEDNQSLFTGNNSFIAADNASTTDNVIKDEHSRIYSETFSTHDTRLSRSELANSNEIVENNQLFSSKDDGSKIGLIPVYHPATHTRRMMLERETPCTDRATPGLGYRTLPPPQRHDRTSLLQDNVIDNHLVTISNFLDVGVVCTQTVVTFSTHVQNNIDSWLQLHLEAKVPTFFWPEEDVILLPPQREAEITLKLLCSKPQVYRGFLFVHCTRVDEGGRKTAEFPSQRHMCSIRAVGETPKIAIGGDATENILNIGAASFDGSTTSLLQLENQGRAEVPLEISISTLKTKLEQLDSKVHEGLQQAPELRIQEKQDDQDNGVPFSLCQRLPREGEIGNKKIRINLHPTQTPVSLWVVFKPIPGIHIPEDLLQCRDTRFTGQVNFTVCGSEYATELRQESKDDKMLGSSSSLLQTVELHAVCSIPKLEVPRVMQAMVFRASHPHDVIERDVPIRNHSLLGCHVNVSVREDDNIVSSSAGMSSLGLAHSHAFSVFPPLLYMQAGEQTVVRVKFLPNKDDVHVSARLCLYIQPRGPTYRLALNGILSMPSEYSDSNTKQISKKTSLESINEKITSREETAPASASRDGHDHIASKPLHITLPDGSTSSKFYSTTSIDDAISVNPKQEMLPFQKPEDILSSETKAPQQFQTTSWPSEHHEHFHEEYNQEIESTTHEVLPDMQRQQPIKSKLKSPAHKSKKDVGKRQSHESVDILLLSDQAALHFGGVEVGEMSSKPVKLRVREPDNTPVEVELSIDGPHANCFSLVENTQVALKPSSTRTNGMRWITLLSSTTDLTAQVLFTPHRNFQYECTLLMRTRIEGSSKYTCRFRIPLLGYGGVSRVDVLEARGSQSGTTSSLLFAEPKNLNIKRVVPGQVVTVEMQIRNIGTRAAYVLGRCADHWGKPMRPERASVSPVGIVIPPNLSKTLRISMAPTLRDIDELKKLTDRAHRDGQPRPPFVTLSLFTGDEILRRRLRMHQRKERDSDVRPTEDALNESNSAVHASWFMCHFVNEERVLDKEPVDRVDPKHATLDARGFLDSMSCVRINITASSVTTYPSERRSITHNHHATTSTAIPASKLHERPAKPKKIQQDQEQTQSQELSHSSHNQVQSSAMMKTTTHFDRMHTRATSLNEIQGAEANVPSHSLATNTATNGEIQKSDMPSQQQQQQVPRRMRRKRRAALQDNDKITEMVSWSVVPITVQVGLADAATVFVNNHQNKRLEFDVTWSAYALDVLPPSGTLQPKERVALRIRPRKSCPFFASRRHSPEIHTERLYVLCDGHQQSVDVHVHMVDSLLSPSATTSTNFAVDESYPYSGVTPRDELSLADLTSTTRHAMSDMDWTPAAVGTTNAPLMVQPSTVTFGPIENGTRENEFLLMRNTTKEVLTWVASATRQAYVRVEDDSGDYVANYPVFVFERQSGTIQPGCSLRLRIKFSPRHAGTFTQLWMIQYSIAGWSDHMKVPIQLRGVATRSASQKFSEFIDDSLPSRRDQLDTGSKSKEHDGSSRQPQESQSDTQSSSSKRVKKQRGLRVVPTKVDFGAVRVGEDARIRVKICNESAKASLVGFMTTGAAFMLRHVSVELRPFSYVELPVTFMPRATGLHEGNLVVTHESGAKTVRVKLKGQAI